MSLTAAITSLRKPSLSDKAEPSSKIPPVMQRPRCSMKLPKIFLSISPRCRRLWSCILAVAARADPVFMIIGAAADAASTPLRDIFMTPPQNLVIRLCPPVLPFFRVLPILRQIKENREAAHERQTWLEPQRFCAGDR